MLTRKDKLINDILIEMRLHTTSQVMSILNEVIIRALYGVEVVDEETGLITADNSNDYILKLFQVKKAPKLSERTVEQYLRHIHALIALINKPLVQMTENDIEYFLMMYQKRGNSNVTVNNAKRFLSAFFTWMRRNKLITENPSENVENYKEMVKMIEHLESEEWEHLKAGCRTNRDRALIEFLRCTAMRDGEIPGVKVNDIDWHDGRIVVYGRKSNKYRVVCIDRVAQDYLEKYLKDRGISHYSNEPLFTSRKTNVALSRAGIYSSVKSIARHAHMDVNVYPHLLRKTTATNIVRRGGSTEEAGEYLGHSERNTAGRYYTHKDPDRILMIFKQRIAAV